MRGLRALAPVLLLFGCGTGIGSGTTPAPGVYKHYLYAADQVNRMVSAYSIEPVTGALTAVGTPIATDGNYALAVSRDGKILFAAGSGTRKLNSFLIDATTGALTAASALALSDTSANGTFVTAHPTGNFVYVSNGRNTPDGKTHVFAYDSVGALTEGGTTATGGVDFPMGLALHPDGGFLVAASYGYASGNDRHIESYSIEPSTGLLTAISGSPFNGATGTLANPRQVVFAPTGRFVYVVDESSAPTKVASFSFNLSSGIPTFVSSVAAASGSVGGAIAISPAGNLVVATCRTGNTLAVYTTDLTTGALTFSANVASSGQMPVAIAFHPAANFFYVGHQDSAEVSAFSYDLTSSAVTALTPATYTVPGTGTHAGAVAIARVLQP